MNARPMPTAAMANAVRALAIDAVKRAKSGHSGMPIGMADAATVLYARHLRFDPSAPHWPDRDRFVLSAGHGSMLLYALLHLTGYADFGRAALKNFRQLGAPTAGHPEFGHGAGIETTTGPLGQGLANAVGMALAAKHLEARFGRAVVDHRIWVIAGDGCLMEGVSHEAASLAGHLGLDNLIVLFDDNAVTIDGPTSLACSDDQLARFASYGWDVAAVDGHDLEALDQAFARAKEATRPVLIACKTVIGKGAPTKQGTAPAHGAITDDAEIAGAKEAWGWTAAPFDVPSDLREAWAALGEAGAAERAAWAARLDALPSEKKSEVERALDGALDQAALDDAHAALVRRIVADRPAIATRKASQLALEAFTAAAPSLIGGSADLTGSNLTKTGATSPTAAGAFEGRYVYWGVREHAMAAAMNGMALHGGVTPYGGTFLVFSDYARPAMRLSALMGLQALYVMSHDSIGLGEDGPTHQPIEQLASLRAMPNLAVFRPADALETAECWRLALARVDGPSVLALSRQTAPMARDDDGSENRSAKGAYILAEAEGPRAVTLLATGTEVGSALEARALLAAKGVAAAVVSMPCFELFEEQDDAYRAAVLGSAPRVAIEAGAPFGWTRYVASERDVVGMTSFGASAPMKALYDHFAITAERMVERALALVG